ncbi:MULTISPECIES: histidine kinase [unclassified Streptomyces]|uniref:sensor histidine kinase n=1 Tax=unclassified Streptomyces TaxID=2593676 RepID=UPI000DBA67F1|nr:histidine kinase [Streptomyces sp. PsTaAH-137]MYT75148.1 two-component sensor histidine kinase [Streptomyces sp. SID8367]RAJ77104.1 histidine kinase [Streptomyces sp. PsTaAH-137]
MTTPTAAEPTGSSVEPEVLLGGAERPADVLVMRGIRRIIEADQHHPWVRGWGVPLLCALFGIPSLQNADTGPGPGVPVLVALSLAFCVPLLWRGTRPLLVFAVTTAVALVAIGLDANTGSAAAPVVALLNVGRAVRPVSLAVCVAIAAAQTALSTVVRGDVDDIGLQTWVVALIQAALVVAVAAAGLVARVVNAYISALHERAVQLEVERDQRARLAAATERARIAREMHDILGHTLAVIVGLAGGAAGLTEAKPKRGADTLRLIADSGRGALAELRRLLAVIGDDERIAQEGTPLAPQPGLTDLDPLLARVRAAGLTVTLHTAEDLPDLSPGLQLAVYRVVQEALTNTLKHAAPDTTVRIALTADGTSLLLTVDDTGPTRTARANDDGRGLVGMRERAALYAGTVTAGPNDQGGWSVRARFLIAATSAPTEKHSS